MKRRAFLALPFAAKAAERQISRVRTTAAATPSCGCTINARFPLRFRAGEGDAFTPGDIRETKVSITLDGWADGPPLRKGDVFTIPVAYAPGLIRQEFTVIRVIEA